MFFVSNFHVNLGLDYHWIARGHQDYFIGCLIWLAHLLPFHHDLHLHCPTLNTFYFRFYCLTLLSFNARSSTSRLVLRAPVAIWLIDHSSQSCVHALTVSIFRSYYKFDHGNTICHGTSFNRLLRCREYNLVRLLCHITYGFLQSIIIDTLRELEMVL